MRIVIQRVLQASVHVEQKLVSQIQAGLLVLVGVHNMDQESDADYLASKTAGLRIFEMPPGKMNLSVKEKGGGVLVVPQFTLLGDCQRGRRPDFTQAARPEKGKHLYLRFCRMLANHGLEVKQGCFQEHMQVQLINDGPVTIVIDSKQ